MVRNVVEVVSCDMDGKEDGIKSFVVSDGETTVEVDLCAEHAAPVLAVMAAGKPREVPKRGTRSTRQSQHQIVPLD